MKKIGIVLIVIVAIAAACGGGLFYVQDKYQKETGFLQGTTFNGEDIAGMTPEQVADEYADKYSTAGKTVKIMENGEAVITAQLEDLGYSFDRDSLLEFLETSYNTQKYDAFAILRTLSSGDDLLSEEAYTFDESKLKAVITGDAMTVERFATVNFDLELDEAANTWYVTEGVKGNEIDDAKLQAAVEEILTEKVDEGNIPDEILIDIPADCYISPEPTGNVTELQTEADAKNLELRKQETLEAATAGGVTYVFGSQTEVLDRNTFEDWFSVDDELNISIDDNKITEYVTSLAAKYNTEYLQRTFYTTTGNTVTIPAGDNEYGYHIDEYAEYVQLKADLLSGEMVTREPVYDSTNDYGNPVYLAREGTDDLAGTYVEVNLTKQHLWFYKNGSLIVESDIVSGSVKDNKTTKTGCFPLAWKQSPRTLTGDAASGSGSYSVNVQYWMPFYEGQGLHDASWRGSFGGNVYQTSGSHGCVNLPPSTAETIYNNIDVGTAIVIYTE